MIWKKYGRAVRRKPGEMNKLEAEYAERLKDRVHIGEAAWFSFDALKLRLAQKTYYTPDFLVIGKDGEIELHEVKGTSRGKPFIEDDAAVKMKVAASLFPFRFKLAWKVKGVWLEKTY